MFSQDDYQWMSRALELARRGRYTTAPNPCVGAVLVKAGVVVGEGWHQRAGEPHAEVYALHAAGEEARGATAYVTLEPCSHHGRTPPCAEALIKAGVTRVVAAMVDPNPQVGGRGLRMLSEAGIKTDFGLLAAEAEALNPGFFKRMRTAFPQVTVKLGASLDGRTAMASGESQWITSPEARRDVQRVRARHDAVLSSAETVRTAPLRTSIASTSAPPRMTSPPAVAAILVMRRLTGKLRTGLASSPSAMRYTASRGGSTSKRSAPRRTGFCTVYSSLPSALTASDCTVFTVTSPSDWRAENTSLQVSSSKP